MQTDTRTPVAAALHMAPLDNDETHKLNIAAEYLTGKEDRTLHQAILDAAAERGFVRVADKHSTPEYDDYDNATIQTISLFANRQGRFVVAYSREINARTGYSVCKDFTDADGFENDLRHWADWDRAHPDTTDSRQSVA